MLIPSIALTRGYILSSKSDDTVELKATLRLRTFLSWSWTPDWP